VPQRATLIRSLLVSLICAALFSAAVAPAAATTPSATVAGPAVAIVKTIGGDGSFTLTASPASTPAGYSKTYQWYRVNLTTGARSAISGATKVTYKPSAADWPYKLTARITFTRGSSVRTSYAAAQDYSVRLRPGDSYEITGGLVPEQTLQITWSDFIVRNSADDSDIEFIDEADKHFTWYWEGTAAPIGTGRVHMITAAEVGKRFIVTWSVARAGYLPFAYKRPPTLPVELARFDDHLVGPAQVSQAGTTLHVAETPNAVSPLDPPTEISYVWQRGSIIIPDAHDADYTLTAADYGQQISVRVVYTRPGFRPSSRGASFDDGLGVRDFSLITSEPTPRITGDLRVGGVASVQTRTYRDARTREVVNADQVSSTYQWYRGEAPIPGETAATYNIQAEDLGSALSVQVTATAPDLIPATARSYATSAIGTDAIAGADAAVVLVQPIAPTTDFSTTLGASVSGLTETGTVTKYQWYRAEAAITGATASSYRLTAADQGKPIRVRVLVSKAPAGGRVWTTAVLDSASQDVTLAYPYQGYVSPAFPRVGDTLSVTPKIYDGSGDLLSGPFAKTYQWYRIAPHSTQHVNISAATQPTYTLTAADRGYRVSVRVVVGMAGRVPVTTSYSEPVVDYGRFTGVSTTHAEVVAAGPGRIAVTIPPTITPAPSVYHYQWLRNGAVIPKATSSTYTLTTADSGKQLSVEIDILRPGFESASLATASAGIRSMSVSAPVAFTGGATVGSLATVVVPDYTGGGSSLTPALSFQWYRNGVAISGAKASTYRPVATDRKTKLSVRVVASLPGYLSLAQMSPPAVVGSGVLSGSSTMPVISRSGPAALTVSVPAGSVTTGTGASAALAYQWLRNGVPISKATSAKYTLVSTDAGKQITVRVTATASGYATVVLPLPAGPAHDLVLSTPASVIAVDGEIRVGLRVGAQLPTYTEPDLATPVAISPSYQWYRSGLPITGATGPTYTLGLADLGKTLSVRVRATANGFLPTTGPLSAPSPTVAAGVTTTAPVVTIIYNTTGYGVHARVDTSLLVPAVPAPTYTYQWYKRGPSGTSSDYIKIAGATASSYVFTLADAPYVFSVTVTMHRPGFEEQSVVLDAAPDAVELASRFYWADWNDPHWLRDTSNTTIGKVATPEPITFFERDFFDEWATPTPVAVTEKCQWYSNTGILTGKTSCSLPVTAAYRNRCLYVQFRVTAPGRLPLTGSTACSPVMDDTLAPVVVPVVSPTTPRVGDTLSIVTPPTWASSQGPVIPSQLGYRWYRGSTPIDGASSATYTVTEDDIGSSLHVEVIATRNFYVSATAVSNVTEVVPTP
jgi:hypothetical protein